MFLFLTITSLVLLISVIERTCIHVIWDSCYIYIWSMDQGIEFMGDWKNPPFYDIYFHDHVVNIAMFTNHNIKRNKWIYPRGTHKNPSTVMLVVYDFAALLALGNCIERNAAFDFVLQWQRLGGWYISRTPTLPFSRFFTRPNDIGSKYFFFFWRMISDPNVSIYDPQVPMWTHTRTGWSC